jgi:Ricin-type beta-trefoil lectin domain
MESYIIFIIIVIIFSIAITAYELIPPLIPSSTTNSGTAAGSISNNVSNAVIPPPASAPTPPAPAPASAPAPLTPPQVLTPVQAITASAVTALPTTPNATQVPGVDPAIYYSQFIGIGSGRCLNIANAADNNGGLQIFDCQDVDNEKFEYNPLTQELRVRSSNKCIDVLNGATNDGGLIRAFDCNKSNAQKWVLTNGMVQNVGSGKCMTVSGASKDNGAPVVIWGCDPNASNGTWNMTNALPTTYKQYQGKNSGKCLNIDGPTNNDGALLQLWDCVGVDNGEFIYNPITQELKIKNSGKCLDVPGGSTDSGIQLQQYQCNLTKPQKWIYNRGMIMNVGSNKCINVFGDSKDDHAPVGQWDCDMTATGGNSLWSFI